MNKWLELLIGLIFITIVIAEWGLNYTGLNFGVAALEVLKGGIIWFLLMIGFLFLLLGISDLRE